MITLNSTILSYNKIKELDEFKPILPPDSIFIPEEKKLNHSFQKFIPDKYDLDKIGLNDLKYQRNSAPTTPTRNPIQLKSYFYNSIIFSPNAKKDKYIESMPINIYNNEKERSIININNYREIDTTKEDLQKSNIYKKEKNKIDNDINNNIKTKKEIVQNKNKGNKNKIGNTNKEKKVVSRNEISTPNIDVDLLNSNMNININKKDKAKKNKIKLDKSAQSVVVKFNYKNILRKDPNSENTIIINTSFYKRNRHKNGNNKSNNQSEINRNSFNSFLKFEESSKDQELTNLKYKSINQTDKKEEILKNFMNSNSNININSSKLDQSNLNSLIINNKSNDNIIINNSKLEQSNLNNSKNNININNEKNDDDEEEEEEVENNIINAEDKNTMKCNNINNYTFRTGQNSINKNINNNESTKNSNNNKNPIINFIKEEEDKKKSFSTQPLLNIYNNNAGGNGNYTTQKLTISSVSSFKKFNFDSVKTIKENDYSRDEDNNKSKNITSNKEENKINNDKENVKENEKEKKIDINNKNNLNIHIKFNNLKKILKRNGLFNILIFLDCYDLMNLLQTNKSLIFLINKSISDAYYHNIKKNLINYRSNFELIKCSLAYSKVKDALKIDFVINIRFVNKIYNNFALNIEKNENPRNKENNEINGKNEKKENSENNDSNKIIIKNNEKSFEPKCFQIIYFYNYFKPVNPKTKLKTKENTKTINMYDYYTYDLYSENDKTPNIYINEDQSSFNINNNTDKLTFIQPILPFKINDKGIINLEIYTSNNDFVNPSSIKIFLKSYDLKSYLYDLKIKEYNNLRICEYENICFHWKYMNNSRIINNYQKIVNKTKKIFEPYFEIVNMLYESIGLFIIKINLVAVKPGKIDSNRIGNDLGINITVRNKKDSIENEIKKNNLLLERRNIYELRIGDNLTLYFSIKISNKNKKK